MPLAHVTSLLIPLSQKTTIKFSRLSASYLAAKAAKRVELRKNKKNKMKISILGTFFHLLSLHYFALSSAIRPPPKCERKSSEQERE